MWYAYLDDSVASDYHCVLVTGVVNNCVRFGNCNELKTMCVKLKRSAGVNAIVVVELRNI